MMFVMLLIFYWLRNRFKANALNTPPGEYGRKVRTQRNWRGPAQAVEHVV